MEVTIDHGYVARFVPQAWVNNNAMDIDPSGETEWDCTAAMTELAREFPDYHANLLSLLEQDDEVLDADDAFKDDQNAPEWVRDHHGPFSIYIRRKDA